METDRRSKSEAINLLRMYKEIAQSNLTHEEYRDRAEDILIEIGGRWSD